MARVSVTIRRIDPEVGEKARFEEHSVEVGERASVLDVLFAVQRGTAPDLGFRFSCRVGMCGSCAMVVNGREQLTCSTLAKPLGPKLRIEPLRNLPVLRDLVVDFEPLFAIYRRAIPHFVPSENLNEFHQIRHSSGEWKTMDYQPECIDCGCCYSACTLATLHPRYLGPMALHRALTLIADPRDGACEERLAAVGGEAGAFGCHTLGNCRDVCPRGISPTRSIQRLKRMAVWQQLRSLFKFSRSNANGRRAT